MTKVRRFKKAYASELLQIARGDLDSARVLEQAKSGRRENILFLAEQCIEKSLKAALCHLEIPVPLVHDLDLILDRFPKENQVPGSDNMGDLSQFASIRRYEEGRAELGAKEIKAVIKLAAETQSWVERLLKG